jgi:hypothetical protein
LSGVFQNPAVPCTSDADCTAPFGACAQRNPGAFQVEASSVIEQGTPSGPITTGGPAKPSTLVSVFCIPPSFSSTVDPVADLPGPGAVSLPGMVQLLP